MNSKKVKIFANVDENTLKQFTDCVEEKFVTEAALMPDAHLGYVAPIGSVLITKGFVVPSWVGYDIGCGVTAIQLKGKNLLKKIRDNSGNIFVAVTEAVPMGLGKLRAEHKLTPEGKEKYDILLGKLEKNKVDEELFKWIKRKAKSNIGSLGHGNHFIEIDYSGKEVWLIIHSGSRNLGHKCASHYMEKAMDENGGTGNEEKTYALKANSKIGKEYLAVLEFCLEIALLNRIEIAKEVISQLEKVLGEKINHEVWTNKNHNHAEQIGKGKFIHRKGATPSKKNEKGIIPGNMRDGTYLIIGKGNKDFLNSSSHGAGRRMSKTQARAEIKLKEFEETMKGIKANVGIGTIDESPFAYKNINEVLKAQNKSVKIVKHLKPIINWKG